MVQSTCDPYLVLSRSGIFDPDWYLLNYPDVAAAAVDPLRHYLEYGAAEGRNPGPFFDGAWYRNRVEKVLRIRDQGNSQRHGSRQRLDQVRHVDLLEYVAAYCIRRRDEVKPQIVVYTAIFGGYDEPPLVRIVDDQIKYVLITDQHHISAPAPWEVRIVPRVFEDARLDARRVKILPHLFFPDFDLSVWIDANCAITRLTADDAALLTSSQNLALPLHEERSCIFKEAEAVTRFRLDSPARVQRQIEYYRSIMFPENFDLHATMFLVRRHCEPRCIVFANSWWEMVSTFSKRDQLSFDYVRWLLKTPVLSLYFRYTENTVFRWGNFGSGGHQASGQIISEHMRHALRIHDIPFDFLATSYSHRYEKWGRTFISRLQKLNEVIRTNGGELEGNLCYFHNEPNYAHAPPDPRRGLRRKCFLSVIAGCNHLFEIGFNAGHSALLALDHTQMKVTSIDWALHPYTVAAAKFLESEFPWRFAFKMDSRDLFNCRNVLDISGCDIWHIDGGHSVEVFANDIQTFLCLSEVGCRVLIDDFYVEPINAIMEYLVTAGDLEPFDDVRSRESAAFVIRRRCGDNSRAGFDARVAELVRIARRAGG